MKRSPADRKGIIGAIIAIIIVVVIIVAVVAVLLIPFKAVSINESREAALPSGVSALNLNVTLDVGALRIEFVDSSSTAVSMSVTGHSRTTLFGSERPTNVSWQESTSGNTLTVSSEVKVGGSSFLPFSGEGINCTLRVAKQLQTTLTASSTTGLVSVSTVDGVTISSANLKSTTGAVKMVLVNNATLAGPLSMETTTGGVQLTWNNVKVSGNVAVSLKATTGGVAAEFTQSAPLGGNVSVNATTSVGGVDLTMDLAGNTSAHVTSHTGLGGVSVKDRTGFTGEDTNLTSNNYPQGSNFEVTADTSTGGINLRLHYRG